MGDRRTVFRDSLHKAEERGQMRVLAKSDLECETAFMISKNLSRFAYSSPSLQARPGDDLSVFSGSPDSEESVLIADSYSRLVSDGHALYVEFPLATSGRILAMRVTSTRQDAIATSHKAIRLNEPESGLAVYYTGKFEDILKTRAPKKTDDSDGESEEVVTDDDGNSDSESDADTIPAVPAPHMKLPTLETIFGIIDDSGAATAKKSVQMMLSFEGVRSCATQNGLPSNRRSGKKAAKSGLCKLFEDSCFYVRISDCHCATAKLSEQQNKEEEEEDLF